MPLVTQKAPDFTSVAVMADNQINESFSLYKNFGENGTVIFFWPLDFTFVCPSEIIAFDKRLNEFKARKINVIGVSIDSEFTHIAWKNTPVSQGGIGQVRFPMVADKTHEVTRLFDIEHAAGVALRGSFLLDKDGTIRHAVINDLPLGRNVDEMLRMVDAMIFTNEHGEVCPAGWNKGDEGMKADAKGVADYLSKHANDL